MKFFRQYGLSLVVALIIMNMCMMPSTSVPSITLGGWVPDFLSPLADFIKVNIDKFAHFTFFFVLSFALCHDFWVQRVDFSTTKMKLWGIVAPMLYGGLIEIMQATLTTTRSGDIEDFFADTLGAICGFFFAKKFVPKWFERENNGGAKCC